MPCVRMPSPERPRGLSLAASLVGRTNAEPQQTMRYFGATSVPPAAPSPASRRQGNQVQHWPRQAGNPAPAWHRRAPPWRPSTAGAAAASVRQWPPPWPPPAGPAAHGGAGCQGCERGRACARPAAQVASSPRADDQPGGAAAAPALTPGTAARPSPPAALRRWFSVHPRPGTRRRGRCPRAG